MDIEELIKIGKYLEEKNAETCLLQTDKNIPTGEVKCFA